MGGPDEPVFRWHEPAASTGRVLLTCSAAACLLAVTVVASVVHNWDVAVVSGLLGLAAAADLRRDTRPRSFVLAGDEGLVVRAGRRTTVLSWDDVAGVRTARRRLGRDRPVVDRVQGGVLRLPVDVPVEELERRRPGPPGPPDGPAPRG